MSAMVAVALVIVASCSDTGGGGGGAALPEPPDSTVSEMASPTDPVVTSPPTSIPDKVVPDEGLPQTESVDIEIDADRGTTQEVAVTAGSPVNIRVRSSQGEEFHLHGYDIELTGVDVMFSFTADRLGQFVLEGHDSGKQLLVLTVFEG